MEECRGTWTSWRSSRRNGPQPSMRHDDDDDDDASVRTLCVTDLHSMSP